MLLQAKPVVQAIESEMIPKIRTFTQAKGFPPRLAVILVGDDPASHIYTQRKAKQAEKWGIDSKIYHFEKTTPASDVKAIIETLNKDPKTHGILLQRPLPFNDFLHWIAPEKDVDGFHPLQVGNHVLGLPGLLPCTPAGIMELLKFYKVSVEGKVACVLGRSPIVGKPMAALLLQADATIIQCHSKTPDAPTLCRQADLVVAGIGKPKMVTQEWIKPGAIVIDVGIHRIGNTLCGDVDFDNVLPICSAITPVPGGVGPMTITLLLKNTYRAATQSTLTL